MTAISCFLLGLCHLDTGSEADIEAAIDPLLCHYQGSIGSLLRRDNLFSTDPSDAFTGLYTLLGQLWTGGKKCFTLK